MRYLYIFHTSKNPFLQFKNKTGDLLEKAQRILNNIIKMFHNVKKIVLSSMSADYSFYNPTSRSNITLTNPINSDHIGWNIGHQ